MLVLYTVVSTILTSWVAVKLRLALPLQRISRIDDHHYPILGTCRLDRVEHALCRLHYLLIPISPVVFTILQAICFLTLSLNPFNGYSWITSW